MKSFIFRRLLLMIPTFLGITFLSFIVLNLAPGAPWEQKLQKLRQSQATSIVNPEVIEALKAHYGMDRPVLERYGIWLQKISTLDFGESFNYGEPVWTVISEKFPVSLQFGVASFFLTYFVGISLGLIRAKNAGGFLDQSIGAVLAFFYCIPNIVFGLILITFFAGGSYLNWFPTGGIQSEDFESLSWGSQVLDRAWHFVLPIICYVIGGFAVTSSLMRNSYLDVISQDFIRFARSKGFQEGALVWRHALRNALIPLATNFGEFLQVFLAGSLIVENIFQLDGIGRLTFTSIMARDYNVIMGLLFLTSVALMLGRLLSDLIYVALDPRINFK